MTSSLGQHTPKLWLDPQDWGLDMRLTSPHWKNDKFEKLKGNQDQRAAVLNKKKMMMMMRRRRRRRYFPLLRYKVLQANTPQGLRSIKFVELICKTYVTARD